MKDLSPYDVEIIMLKTSFDIIDDMVNHEMMDFYGKPIKEVHVKTRVHQKLFLILLVDFISKKNSLFENISSLDYLTKMISNPLLSKDIEHLSKSVRAFNEWCLKNISIKNLCINSKSNIIDLEISRKDLIYIAGNVSKHNITNLSFNIKKLQDIIEEKYNNIEYKDTFISFKELYDRFMNDCLILQTTNLAKMLNDIKNGIISYLRPLYNTVLEECEDGTYKYKYPKEITSPIGQEFFWNLMNDVRLQISPLIICPSLHLSKY